MSLDDFPLLRTSGAFNAAVESWNRLTGHEPGEVGDAVLADCLVHLHDAGLMGPDADPARPVMALLTGAYLHASAILTSPSDRGRALHLIESTRHAASVIAAMEHLTGLEDSPHQLARLIVAIGAM